MTSYPPFPGCETHYLRAQVGGRDDWLVGRWPATRRSRAARRTTCERRWVVVMIGLLAGDQLPAVPGLRDALPAGTGGSHQLGHADLAGWLLPVRRGGRGGGGGGRQGELRRQHRVGAAARARPRRQLARQLGPPRATHTAAGQWLTLLFRLNFAERTVPELIPVVGNSQPAGDVSHKPGGGTAITFHQACGYRRNP